MAEPKDIIVPTVKELGEEMRGRFDKVDARLESIEAAQKTFRNALTADTMMSKFITGDFEERIEALERKVEELTKRQ